MFEAPPFSAADVALCNGERKAILHNLQTAAELDAMQKKELPTALFVLTTYISGVR